MYINLIQKEENATRKRVNRSVGKVIFLSFVACFQLQVIQLFCSFLLPSGLDKTTFLLFNILIYVVSFLGSFGAVHLIIKFVLKNKTITSPKRLFPKYPFLYITGTIGITYIVNLVILNLFPNFVDEFSIESSIIADTPIEIILYYLFMAVLPAFLEEYAFRHVILTNLLPYGKWGAIICSSLLFGIVHIEPPKVIMATVFGLILAICREYTGSLIIPIVIHFFNNALSVTFSLVPSDSAFNPFLSLTTFFLIGCGIVALCYYLTNGISKKSISIIKPNSYGYKLPLRRFLFKFVFNIGIIPFLYIYFVYFYQYFLG